MCSNLICSYGWYIHPSEARSHVEGESPDLSLSLEIHTTKIHYHNQREQFKRLPLMVYGVLQACTPGSNITCHV